jgi:hypothetical protein
VSPAEASHDRPFPLLPPVAVGGVGGSGTRVVAAILVRLGFFLGSDLNDVLDNLWFTLLFKRPEILSIPDERLCALADLFVSSMTVRRRLTDDELALVQIAAAFDRPQHDREWLRRRARSLVDACGGEPVGAPRWGWKEPNTHVGLDRLARCIPALHYIHVVRNGLDMACSDNQNQLQFWGEPLPPGIEPAVTPRRSLAYWCTAQRRVLRVGRAMGRRFLLLNFDRLCQESERERELRRLFDFLGVNPPADQVAELHAAIVTPESSGRFKACSPDAFDPADVAYVRSLGFDTRFG